ncbi:MAG: urease accessory protein UreE [Pseudomonadota bacterium]
MIRALALDPTGSHAPHDTISLVRERRYARRTRLESDRGLTILLDLPEATELEDGAALVLEDGRHIRVVAAPEPLLEIRARDARHLAQLAWHIGNRHLPAEIQDGRLLIQRDHVIADMVDRLGGAVSEVIEPFRPAGGAYGHGRTHGHHHHHDPHADPNAHIPGRHS